jgi:hypothetical protein
MDPQVAWLELMDAFRLLDWERVSASWPMACCTG